MLPESKYAVISEINNALKVERNGAVLISTLTIRFKSLLSLQLSVILMLILLSLLIIRKVIYGIFGWPNTEMGEKKKILTFNFLPEDVKCKLTLIADGECDNEFSTQYMVVKIFNC
jgi:hypothetical protein